MREHYQQNADVFKAFCNEYRLQILELLQTGEKCACKLQEHIEISQSNLSHHMKILCNSGIVSSRQEGKWMHYSISPQGSQQAAKLLSDLTKVNEDPKRILIEYLYLDLNSCDRCIGTDSVLDEVVEALAPTFKLAGYNVEYKKIEMASAELATQYRFVSSPTIRVNGHDICNSVTESSCGCCSDISGTDVDCRVFEYEGATYEVPPKAMLTEAILKIVFSVDPNRKDDRNSYNDIGCQCDGESISTSNSEDNNAGSFVLIDNLKRFYDGKEKLSSGCSCGCDC